MSTHPLTLQRLTEMKENFDRQFPPSVFDKGADMSPETWRALRTYIPGYSFNGKDTRAYLDVKGPWIDIHLVPSIPFGEVEPCRCKERANEHIPANHV